MTRGEKVWHNEGRDKGCGEGKDKECDKGKVSKRLGMKKVGA